MNTAIPSFVIIGSALSLSPEQRRDPQALMVALLNDDALCDRLRKIAMPNCFGEVIRDLALAMVEAS